MRAYAARRWMSENLQIRRARAPRWNERFNVKQKLRAFDLSDLESVSAERLGEMATMPSLRAYGGPWKLPRWPQERRLQKQIRASWRSWTTAHRLHPRVHRSMDPHLHGHFVRLRLPECPPEWAAQEDHFSQVLSKPRCFVPDDRDAQKCWPVKLRELVAYLTHALQVDPMWKFRSEISIDMVMGWCFARAELGLPTWLRQRARAPGRKLSAPICSHSSNPSATPMEANGLAPSPSTPA